MHADFRGVRRVLERGLVLLGPDELEICFRQFNQDDTMRSHYRRAHREEAKHADGGLMRFDGRPPVLFRV